MSFYVIAASGVEFAKLEKNMVINGRKQLQSPISKALIKIRHCEIDEECDDFCSGRTAAICYEYYCQCI